jgi:V/A-type H+/Na+-transporting ATPase subunit I
MLFPEEMTEMELIVAEKDLLAVTRTVAGWGVFQQVDASNMGSQVGVESTESWRDRAAAYALLERQLTVLIQTLSVEEGLPLPAQPDLLDIASIRSQVDRIEQEVRESTGQLSVNEKRISQLQNQLRELGPIADTDLDLSVLRQPRYIHSILGTMPVANIERMRTSLSRTPHVLDILNQDRENAVVWLTGTRANADVLERAAHSAFLTPLEISDEAQNGTPSEMIVSLNNSVKAATEQIGQHKIKIDQLRERYEKELLDLLWRARTSRMLADVMAHYGKLNYTYLIVGWVPSSKKERLEASLRQVSKTIIIDSRRSKRTGHANQHIPVAMRNPGFLSSFQSLTTTYARPRYEEIDPTILIAVTFPLLYGAMFGDVGHGLLLALVGWLLASKIVPQLRGMASLGWVIVACGLVATVFGFLYGSIFGFEDVLPNSPFFKRFVWLQPLHNPIEILGIAIGVGIVLLNAGIILNLYNAWRAKDWGRLLFDSNGLFGWILYLSFLVLIGWGAGELFVKRSIFPGYAIVLAVVGLILGILLAVIFSEPLKHWIEGHRPLIEGSGVMFAVQSGAELLEKMISMFSNTLSYVRVGAFAVAHGGFCLAIFILAKLLNGGQDGGFVYWVVVVFGNIGLVFLEGFIVYIQTMRLHYYEFFSKFFTGGGAPYEPLAPLGIKEA